MTKKLLHSIREYKAPSIRTAVFAGAEAADASAGFAKNLRKEWNNQKN